MSERHDRTNLGGAAGSAAATVEFPIRFAEEQNQFATRGARTALQAIMADPTERQGVTPSMHHARRKKLSRHGASAVGKSSG
jgi:hypothetical protein